MRKRWLLVLGSIFLVILGINTWAARGTGGARIKKTTTKAVINPINLYKESHALLIGASAYQHWPRLRGVLDDVTAVQAALEKQGFTVTKVLNPDRVTLLGAFDNFINQYGLNENNRLLFYFAGHGYTVKKTMGEMGYIVPVDAPNPLEDLKGFLRVGLDMAQIEVYAKRIDSKHALFVFDSCFSGTIFALSRAITPPAITYKTAMPVRQFITSGSADEEVPDQSVFRTQFVSGLGGEADSNGDGYITGKELGMFLEDKVINYSSDSQHPQFGTIRNPELDKGDFVFQVAVSEQLPPPPENNGISFSDLEAEDKANRDSTARSGWDNWQEQMQRDFDKTAAFAGSAASRRKAWGRFLTTYAENNTYSQEDERLRKEAKRKQAAVRDEPVVVDKPPPVVVPGLLPYEPETVAITGRYQDNGDGTVTDTTTNLMWKRCAEGQTWNGSTCAGSSSEITWRNAMPNEQQKSWPTFAGYSDWRMPTIENLRTLVYCSSGKPKTWNDNDIGFSSCEGDYKRPTIDTTAFPNSPSSWFWSASSVASDSAGASFLSFYHGYELWHKRSLALSVRLVRGRQ